MVTDSLDNNDADNPDWQPFVNFVSSGNAAAGYGGNMVWFNTGAAATPQFSLKDVPASQNCYYIQPNWPWYPYEQWRQWTSPSYLTYTYVDHELREEVKRLRAVVDKLAKHLGVLD